jgi:pyrroline-5-carboxylate reductase
VNTSTGAPGLRGIAILGAGKMGEILAAGILRAGLAPAAEIFLSDVSSGRVEELVGRYGMASKPSGRSRLSMSV